MKNLLKYLMLSLLLILAANVTSVLVAQDEIPEAEATAEVIAVATVEPGSVVVITQPVAEETEDSIGGVTMTGLFAIFCVGFTLLQGFLSFLQSRNITALTDGLKEALERKNVKDEAEALYLRSSMTVKDFVSMLKSLATVGSNMNIPGVDPALDALKKFGDEVTDGLPNTPPVTGIR